MNENPYLHWAKQVKWQMHFLRMLVEGHADRQIRRERMRALYNSCNEPYPRPYTEQDLRSALPPIDFMESTDWGNHRSSYNSTPEIKD